MAIVLALCHGAVTVLGSRHSHIVASDAAATAEPLDDGLPIFVIGHHGTQIGTADEREQSLFILA